MKRRAFIGASTSGLLAATHGVMHGVTHGVRLSQPIPSHALDAPDDLFTLRDPRVTAMAHTAIDAARSAGATYADVKVTYTTQRELSGGEPVRPVSTTVQVGMSVRALVNGYWGWAATPYVSVQDAPRIGQEATRLAAVAAARGRPRSVEWGANPIAEHGTWTTPIQINPFDIATDEVCDWMDAEESYQRDLYRVRHRNVNQVPDFKVFLYKQERLALSTEGSMQLQTIYAAGGQAGVINVPLAQGGWELFTNPPLRERVRVGLDQADHAPPSAQLPILHSLEVGRYDLVFTANAMASLLDATIAPATQIDRALGYEANAGGSSFLGPDPLIRLGTQIAAPLVTITADRSSPHGLATIGWDDDGVVPEDFALIKDGHFVDYQTTREQAAWLTPWYQQHGTAIRSHGCAASSDALTYPMQHTPNLTLHPGTESLLEDDLIAGVDRGLLVTGVNVAMDFQCLNGSGYIGGANGPAFYLIQHGRRVAVSDTKFGEDLVMEVQFRTPDLWKAIKALGGAESVQTQLQGTSTKGEPVQAKSYSIAAVPALMHQQAVVDPKRKA